MRWEEQKEKSVGKIHSWTVRWQWEKKKISSLDSRTAEWYIGGGDEAYENLLKKVP